MDKFDWKNGLFIMAAVVLNCVVCGALMRPLVPAKKKPRKKNFFDRLVSYTTGLPRKFFDCLWVVKNRFSNFK